MPIAKIQQRLRNARIRFQNKFENQNGGGGNDPGVESWRTDSLSRFSKLEGNGPVARACGNDFYCRSSFGPVKSS